MNEFDLFGDFWFDTSSGVFSDAQWLDILGADLSTDAAALDAFDAIGAFGALEAGGSFAPPPINVDPFAGYVDAFVDPSTGETIGVLPGTDRSAANPWVSHAIATGMGHARNAIIVGSADAVIAIDGEFGTLSEIAFAAKLGIPLIGLGTWEVSHPGGIADPVTRATDPAEAVRLALGA